ncbi:hypothetical protein [Cohnella herbarum]|uniref:Uncharacterized protein n=1 Tax=Cohnella herbarum TaxID=2728023 RepID=A0A7Z2ZQ51_9BACL|nr:hypothetical protein [Cohnella herbarum]QJD87590.1 hypothetical protein HH215_33360 [Cohnella herbarum]
MATIYFNWIIMRPLLILLQDLEAELTALDTAGVTVLPLEAHKFELIHTILGLCGIERDDDEVAYLCDPLFSFLEGNITIRQCMEKMDLMFIETKKERRGRDGAGNERALIGTS